MLELVFKDFRVSRDSYIIYATLFFIIFEIFSLSHLSAFAAYGENASSSVALMAYFVLFIIVQLNTFYIDSKNDSLLFIGALPLKRYEIVKSKYLFMLVVLVLPIALFAVNISMQKIFGAGINGSMLIGDFFILAFSANVMLAFSAIVMPIFYWFNYKRAMAISSVLSYLLILAPISAFALLKGITIPQAADELNTLNTTLTGTTIIFTSVFSITFYIISAIISKKAFERKDL